MASNAPGAGLGGPGGGERSSGGRPGGRPGGRGRGRYAPRRKVCQFCVDKVDNIDYKDVTRLRRYVSERGKIEPRRKTGTCAKHQRKLSTAIKRAREIALLPYAPVHIQEMGGWFQPPPFLPQHQPAPAPVAAPVPAAGPVGAAPAPAAPVPAAPTEAPNPTGAPMGGEPAAADTTAAGAPLAATETAPVGEAPTETVKPEAATAGEHIPVQEAPVAVE